MWMLGFAQTKPAGGSSRSGEERHPGDRDPLPVRVLPWAVSLVVHVGVVVLGFFAVWSTVTADRDEQVVPELGFSEEPPALVEMDPAQEQADSLSETRPSDEPEASPAEVQAASDVELDFDLSGLEALGEATPFGMDHSLGDDLEAEFFGVRGNAERVVFVIDASGSLLGEWQFVIEELQRSIERLDSRQQFAVIFFQDGRMVEAEPSGLRPASGRIKRQRIEWIAPAEHNVRPGGGTTPWEGLRQAFRYAPQLVFLLSDDLVGQGGGEHEVARDELLQAVRRNHRGAAVNTIQFLYRDALQREGEAGTMERIAELTGGRYRFVGEAELGLE